MSIICYKEKGEFMECLSPGLFAFQTCVIPSQNTSERAQLLPKDISISSDAYLTPPSVGVHSMGEPGRAELLSLIIRPPRRLDFMNSHRWIPVYLNQSLGERGKRLGVQHVQEDVILL